MIQYKKILMTLALLLTAASGAWAEETLLTTITFGYSGPVYSESGIVTVTGSNYDSQSVSGKYSWTPSSTYLLMSATVEVAAGYNITKVVFWSNDNGNYANALEDTAEPYICYSAYSQGKSLSDDLSNKVDGDNIAKIEVYGTYEPPIEVIPVAEPAANTKQWTFTMPAFDVVLTPRYAAATIYDADETEKQAYETLKEAFANVQDGDVIKLDWDVTLTENLQTPTRDGGVKFTIDFNGYTLDAGTYLSLANEGDELTFTDNSGKDKLGGLKAIAFSAAANAKYIFDKGRYYFGGGITAEMMNTLFETSPNDLVEGKEFVDLEGGADANDGFTMIIAWKAFELTIGAGRFDTFFAAQNVALNAETPAGVGLYTITDIEEDSETGEPTVAYLGKLTGVVEKETPMLVYNGTDAQQTVKIKVTPAEANAQNQGISPLEYFMGTAVAKTFTEDDMAAADYYALSGGKLFVPVYDAGTIGKNQCWLQFNHANGAPARGITLVFEKEEATGVNEVSEVNEVSDGAWYDLSGRKLDGEPTAKGVYIKDGKKVIIK